MMKTNNFKLIFICVKSGVAGQSKDLIFLTMNNYHFVSAKLVNKI